MTCSKLFPVCLCLLFIAFFIRVYVMFHIESPAVALADTTEPPWQRQQPGRVALENKQPAIAVFFQVDDAGDWPPLSACLGSVAAAQPKGMGLDVYIAHPASSNQTKSLWSGIQSKASATRSVRSVYLQPVSSAEGEFGSFLLQLEAAQHRKLRYKYMLKLHAIEAGGWLPRGIEALCGTRSQVMSAQGELAGRNGSQGLDLVAPVGTILSRETRVADVSPQTASQCCQGSCADAVPDRIVDLAQEAYTLMNRSGTINPHSVFTVAGSMFWARYDALHPETMAAALPALLEVASVDSLCERWLPGTMLQADIRLGELPAAPKPMALYFPQFHPFPENDKFWGVNFTEWTLLKPFQGKGIRKPLGVNSGGLGMYDLTSRETRRRQAELAGKAGLNGFVFYHYWFSGPNIKSNKVMYKIPELMLTDGEPNVQFMLSWANEPWTQRWDGNAKESAVLLEQEYGDEPEWKTHFDYLVKFFRHPKYIRIDGKPAFIIYNLGHFGDKLAPMLQKFKQWSREAGLGGLYAFTTVGGDYFFANKTLTANKELDAAYHFVSTCCQERDFYVEGKRYASTTEDLPFVKQPVQYWGAYVGFDRRVRSGYAWYKDQVSPWDFQRGLKRSFRVMSSSPKRDVNPNLFFIGSWNEWNEQSVLEPDDTHGTDYLDALRTSLESMPARRVTLGRHQVTTAPPKASASCPLQRGIWPFTQQPFFFFHIPRTGGDFVKKIMLQNIDLHGYMRDSQQKIIASEGRGIGTGYSAKNTDCASCPFSCQEGDIDPFYVTDNSLLCDHALVASCAALFVGHFDFRMVSAMQRDNRLDNMGNLGCKRNWSPQRPARYSCFIMMRDPIERALAHYNWYYKEYRPDPHMPPFERAPWHLQEAFADNVMTRYLGDGNLTTAKGMIDRCLVGMHRDMKTTMLLLSLHMRWIDVPAFDIVEHKPLQIPAGLKRVQELNGKDVMLFQYAEEKFKRQLVCLEE